MCDVRAVCVMCDVWLCTHAHAQRANLLSAFYPGSDKVQQGRQGVGGGAVGT